MDLGNNNLETQTWLADEIEKIKHMYERKTLQEKRRILQCLELRIPSLVAEARQDAPYLTMEEVISVMGISYSDTNTLLENYELFVDGTWSQNLVEYELIHPTSCFAKITRTDLFYFRIDLVTPAGQLFFVHFFLLCEMLTKEENKYEKPNDEGGKPKLVRNEYE